MVDIPVCRVQLVRESSLSISSELQDITSPQDAARIFNRHLDGADREHFAILLLTTKNHVLGMHTVSVGTLNSSVVAAREVFKAAILANAAAIVLCHNHPSGDPTPSPEDVAITRKLIQAGVLLDIEVLDHLIVNGQDERFVSLRERRLGFDS
jgi:DNA repair protein RadC